jgi:hypothetical protein
MPATILSNRQVSSYTLATTTSSTYNDVGTTGDRVIIADTTSNNITINLPTAVGNSSKITIKKLVGVNTVTVDASGTQTIDDGLTATLINQYETITLVSNSANWFII